MLTDKPTIYAANVKESDLAGADTNPYVKQVRAYAAEHHACETVVISAQIESDLIDLSADEAKAFLKELGVEESGVGALIRGTYHLLGLRTYFTAGEKEVRAWTIHAGDTAPKAAGVIHSDFERGFIKAETVAYEDLVQCGSVAVAREKGLYRMEGQRIRGQGRGRVALQIQRLDRDFQRKSACFFHAYCVEISRTRGIRSENRV